MFKYIIDLVNSDSVIYLYLDIYFLTNLLAKMNINTCIKTEPTTMADNELEVNIYDIDMIILLIIVLLKFLFLVRLREHPSIRNLGYDDDLDGDDGVT